MKRFIFLIILNIGMGFCSISQNPYYDAISLAPKGVMLSNHRVAFKTEDTVFISKILRKYAPDAVYYSALYLSFQGNPFIELPTIKSLSSKGAFDISGYKSTLAAGSPISGLDVTNIAKGVSLFMIERAKQELNIVFFDQFKKFVQNNPEVRVLFPKTTDALSNLLSYKYPEMIPTLRIKFEEDLALLPLNFVEILSLPRYESLLADYPAIRVVVRSFPLIYQLETRESHPADIIREFATFPEWKESLDDIDFQNAGNSIRLASVFSESLRVFPGNDTAAWISPRLFYSSIVNDPIARTIYCGLMYQLIRNEKISFNGTLLTVQIDRDEARMTGFETYSNRFLRLAEKVTNDIQTIKEMTRNKEKPAVDNYYSYISTSIDLVELGFDISKYFDKTFTNSSGYLVILRNANDLYKNVYKGQYSPAIANSVNILSTTIDLIKKNQKIKDDKDLKDSLARVKKFQNKLPDLLRYGLFMANVCEAKTPEDIQNALEAAALPVGSSAIKKYSDFNIAIQSYLGAYWIFIEPTSKTDMIWNNRFGVTAPIGVSFSYGLRNAGSLSLFGSLFDLGAIVDYELKTTTDTASKTTTTTKDYKVELGQIFSPGVFFVYGGGLKIPLSLGIGAQYGPGLGKIDNGTTVVNNPSWRFNLFLCVDIPMFNLFTKTWHPWNYCVGRKN